MNKKGFTLVELVLVIVIIGIITLITTTGVLDALEQNRVESAKTVEKLLINDLRIYNIDTEEDFWCIEGEEQSGTAPCVGADNDRIITIEELLNTNRDINLGECLINGNMIAHKTTGQYYVYTANIVCSKDISKDRKNKTYLYSTDGYTLTNRPDSVYYDSTTYEDK